MLQATPDSVSKCPRFNKRRPAGASCRSKDTRKGGRCPASQPGGRYLRPGTSIGGLTPRSRADLHDQRPPGRGVPLAQPRAKLRLVEMKPWAALQVDGSSSRSRCRSAHVWCVLGSISCIRERGGHMLPPQTETEDAGNP